VARLVAGLGPLLVARADPQLTRQVVVVVVVVVVMIMEIDSDALPLLFLLPLLLLLLPPPPPPPPPQVLTMLLDLLDGSKTRPFGVEALRNICVR